MEDRNEKLFEALLKVAADEALKQKMDALPSCEELDKLYPRPAAMDKRIKKIIKQNEATYKLKRVSKGFLKVAAFMGLFLALGGTILMSVEASRNFILNTIINFQKESVSFDFSNENESLINGYIIGYLPNGFELISSQKTGDISVSVYMNQDDVRIIFQVFAAESLMTSMDNENAIFSTVKVNKKDGYFFEGEVENSNNILMWQFDHDVLELISSMSMDEMIYMAENIYRKQK